MFRRIRTTLCIFELAIIFVSSQALNEEDAFCKTSLTCPKYPNVKLTMMVMPSVPNCYCDSHCQVYKDCCKQKTQQHVTTEFQNLIYDEDPTLYSSCLRIDGHNIGIWVVNRCGTSGTICSDNSTFGYLLSHLPVTDKDNQTYINEDCAVCNNVTSYETWSVFFEENRYMSPVSEDYDPQTYINLVTDGQISSKDNGYGRIYLTPPAHASVRVCYRFKLDQHTNTTQCPAYQNPILGDTSIDFYKNVQCCKNDGKCMPLKWDACILDRRLPKIKMFPPEAHGSFNNISTSVSTKSMPGVLLQFKSDESKCSKNKVCTERCQKSDESCARRIQFMNFPLKENYLKFVVLESDVATGYFGVLLRTVRDVIVRNVLELFATSKWRLKAKSGYHSIYLYVYVMEGKDCIKNTTECATFETSFTMYAETSLTVAEIEELKAWTQHIDLFFNYDGKLGNIKLTGSFSRILNNSVFNCSCKQYGGKIGYVVPLFTPYKVNWLIDFAKCSHFQFFVNDFVKEVKISCKEKTSINGICTIQDKYAVLGTFMIIVAYDILNYI